MEQIKWAALIRELEGFGWKASGIAAEIGLKPSSLSDVKNGASKEPGGTAAVKLFHLHKREAAKAAARARRAA